MLFYCFLVYFPFFLPKQLFIDNKFCDSAKGATFGVTDPRSGDEIARYKIYVTQKFDKFYVSVAIRYQICVEFEFNFVKLKSFQSAGPEDVDRAVKAARKAFDEGPWPRMFEKIRINSGFYHLDRKAGVRN